MRNAKFLDFQVETLLGKQLPTYSSLLVIDFSEIFISSQFTSHENFLACKAKTWLRQENRAE